MHFTVSDFLLDLVQNSVEAGATHIVLKVLEGDRFLELVVDDNGKGMDKQTLARVRDPFFTDGVKHVKRKVGLGIPFLVQALEQVDGDFELESQPGKGTHLRCTFPLDHVDTPQLGDLPGFFLLALSFDGEYELEIHRLDKRRGVALACPDRSWWRRWGGCMMQLRCCFCVVFLSPRKSRPQMGRNGRSAYGANRTECSTGGEVILWQR